MCLQEEQGKQCWEQLWEIARSIRWHPSWLWLSVPPGSRVAFEKVWLDCTPQFPLPGGTFLLWVGGYFHFVLISLSAISSQSGELTNLLVAGGSPGVLRPLWWLWRKRGWLLSPLFQVLEKKDILLPLSWGLLGEWKHPSLLRQGHPKTAWGGEEKSTVHRYMWQIFFCCCLFWEVRKWTVLRVSLTVQAFSLSSNLIPTEAGDPIYWGAKGNACCHSLCQPF